MDPVTNKLLQGTPYVGMGGTQERNALVGVIRNLISEDKYTVDYILNYAQSVGYQRQMAEEVFKELTGLSPKLIVNNNEYYNMPSYVPNMCIAWGTSKSNKEKAYYIVPFEYGYAVMEKDEVNAPIPTVISATIPEAFEELKKVAKGIQTLDKIITKKLLEAEDVQTDAHTVHQVNLPYAASPLQVLKKNFKDKVLSVSEFERQASKLLASEEITVDEAEDLMAWKQDLIDEDETYGNDVLELDEQWKPLDAEVDDDDFNGYHSSEEYLNSYEHLYETLVTGNIDLYKEKLNKLSKAELMDYIAWAEEMGIGREELKLHYITASKKIKSNIKKDSNFEKALSYVEERISNDNNNENDSYPLAFEEAENLFGIGADELQEEYDRRTMTWRNASKKVTSFLTMTVSADEFSDIWNNARECGDEIWSIKDGKLLHIIGYNNFGDTIKITYEPVDDFELWEECKDNVPFDFSILEYLPEEGIIKSSSKKVKSSKIIQVNVYDIDWNFDELDEEDKPTEKLPDFYSNLNIEIDEDAEDFKMTKDDIENMIDDRISEELFNEFGYYPESYNWTYSNKKASKKQSSQSIDELKQIIKNMKEEGKSRTFAINYLDGKGIDYKIINEILNKAGYNNENKVLLKGIQSCKKVTAENMTLDDIEAEDNKDQVQEEIEKIEETPAEDIFAESTPEQYLDKALQEDKVDTINDVVSKCIDKFSDKFKDFDKYQVKILSYNTKVLEDDKPMQEEMVQDKEIDANAILQVILQITNNAEEANIKKVLAVFSITNGELHWTGTVRGENDQVVAFTEEGLDALFEVNETSEEELEDII